MITAELSVFGIVEKYDGLKCTPNLVQALVIIWDLVVQQRHQHFVRLTMFANFSASVGEKQTVNFTNISETHFQ